MEVETVVLEKEMSSDISISPSINTSTVEVTVSVTDVDKEQDEHEEELLSGQESMPALVAEQLSTTTTTAGAIEMPEEVVRTLFVSGLPVDATPRELYLLCRAYKGFVDSKLNSAKNKYGKPLAPIGFVTFATREDAESAMAELQNVQFDPSLSTTIRVEFAKCNSKLSKNPQDKSRLTPSPHSLSPSPELLRPPSAPPNLFGGAAYFTGAPLVLSPRTVLTTPYSPMTDPSQLSPFVHDFNQTLYPVGGDTIYHNPYLQQPSAFQYMSGPASMGSQQSLASLTATQTPCSTLFVANFGPFVTERELTEVFSSSPGFINVRVYTKGASPVAFVKYIDTRCATQAMVALQGTVLRYSDRGGIRIEYAKSKMTERDGSSSVCGSTLGLTGGDTSHNVGAWTSSLVTQLDPCESTIF